MKRMLRVILLVGLLHTARGAAADDFETYALVIARNIFDPGRQADARPADVPTTDTQTTATTTTETAADDSIDLLGTWISDKQSLAFTEGSRSEFTATPALGDELGGWRIVEIDPQGIVLADAERRLRVSVGERIERNAGEDWRLTERGSLSTTTTTSTQGESSSGENAGAPGSVSDIMKRMRERREKENQK